jgi:hypothetical protein
MEAIEIENLNIVSSLIDKYSKYDSNFLYFVKLICIDKNKKKNNNYECLKIGTTNSPLIRFKQFGNEFSPNPIKISVIFIANFCNSRNEALESLFKNFNKEMINSFIKKKSGKNSTEIYLYNQSMINNFYLFYKQIENKLNPDCFFLNNSYFTSIEKYKNNIDNIFNDTISKKRSINDVFISDKRSNININNQISNINEFIILNCPNEITFDSLKNSQFAIFYDDSKSNMFGWYKATLLDLKPINKYNSSFLIQYNNLDFTQNFFISINNYGIQNLWVLIQ